MDWEYDTLADIDPIQSSSGDGAVPGDGVDRG